MRSTVKRRQSYLRCEGAIYILCCQTNCRKTERFTQFFEHLLSLCIREIRLIQMLTCKKYDKISYPYIMHCFRGCQSHLNIYIIQSYSQELLFSFSIIILFLSSYSFSLYPMFSTPSFSSILIKS